MGKELRNTEWILANVSLWVLPPSLSLDFYPFLPPARYIFLTWSTFREICFFRCTVFLDLVRSSSIFDVATLPSRRNCSRLFAGCKWLESSTPLQYFSNFSFFFFDKFEGVNFFTAIFVILYLWNNVITRRVKYFQFLSFKFFRPCKNVSSIFYSY